MTEKVFAFPRNVNAITISKTQFYREFFFSLFDSLLVLKKKQCPTHKIFQPVSKRPIKCHQSTSPKRRHRIWSVCNSSTARRYWINRSKSIRQRIWNRQPRRPARPTPIKSTFAICAKRISARRHRCKYTCAHIPASGHSFVPCAKRRSQPKATWRCVHSTSETLAVPAFIKIIFLCLYYWCCCWFWFDEWSSNNKELCID